jgi:hypothetical protein
VEARMEEKGRLWIHIFKFSILYSNVLFFFLGGVSAFWQMSLLILSGLPFHTINATAIKDALLAMDVAW